MRVGKSHEVQCAYVEALVANDQRALDEVGTAQLVVQLLVDVDELLDAAEVVVARRTCG